MTEKEIEKYFSSCWPHMADKLEFFNGAMHIFLRRYHTLPNDLDEIERLFKTLPWLKEYVGEDTVIKMFDTVPYMDYYKLNIHKHNMGFNGWEKI